MTANTLGLRSHELGILPCQVNQIHPMGPEVRREVLGTVAAWAIN